MCLPSIASARGAQPVPTRSYAPAYREIARRSAVFATGNLQLLGSAVDENQQTPGGMLVNVATGTRRQITPPQPGCVVSGLSPTTIGFLCSTGPAGGDYVEALSSGRLTKLPRRDESGTLISPFVAGLGADWAELQYPDPTEQHEPADDTSFFNLSTDQLVPEFRTIGGTTYANLSSPSLMATACSPVTVRGAEGYDGAMPGDLTLIGSTVIHTGGRHKVIGAQRCGSRTIQRYTVYGFSDNRQIAIWSHALGVLWGIDGRTGQRFEITFPKALDQPDNPRGPRLEVTAINSRYIYLEGYYGTVWQATIPSGLR